MVLAVTFRNAEEGISIDEGSNWLRTLCMHISGKSVVRVQWQLEEEAQLQPWLPLHKINHKNQNLNVSHTTEGCGRTLDGGRSEHQRKSPMKRECSQDQSPSPTALLGPCHLLIKQVCVLHFPME